MTDHAPEVRLCVLLACFAGHRRAAKVRRALRTRIRDHGDAILDETVLDVDAKHRVQTYDPRKTAAGALTAALTWGLFGLVTGGLQGFGIWAILGAVCGGLFASYSLRRFTKDQRKRIGEHLPADSSALVAFVKGSDPTRILASAESFEPQVASVVAIGTDLSGLASSAPSGPVNGVPEPAGASASSAQLTMLLARYPGEHTGRQAAVAAGATKNAKGSNTPQMELVVEADKQGKRRVIDPTMGAAAASKSDIVSWGGFGLVYGVIVGAAGNGGILNGIERGLITALGWGAFGAVAGALYGLWTGRSISARRLKGIGPLVPPDSSLTLAWAPSTTAASAIGDETASASQRLVVQFVADEHGLILNVADPSP